MTHRHAHGRERPSLRWIASGVAVALGAGIGGWAVADRIAADPPSEPAAIERVLNAGPARLKVSTDWQPARRPPALPGLSRAPAWLPYAGLDTTVSVALVPADDPALVPAALVEKAEGGLPRPEKARVVGLQARAYRGVITGDSVLDIYAIPTTRGVLTLVCAARDGAAEAPTWCLNGLDQITVKGATPLMPDASTAYHMLAPERLKRLDTVRVAERKQLRRANGPVGQERAARALWRAYRTTADELAPFTARGQPPAKVIGALRRTARAYRALGTAAHRRSKRAWSRAKTDVSRAERVFKARVADAA